MTPILTQLITAATAAAAGAVIHKVTGAKPPPPPPALPPAPELLQQTMRPMLKQTERRQQRAETLLEDAQQTIKVLQTDQKGSKIKLTLLAIASGLFTPALATHVPWLLPTIKQFCSALLP